VLPGFIDVHTHLSTIVASDAGRMLLRHGVTTVREVLADTPAAVERAEIWAAGRQPGPRLVIDPAGDPDDPVIPPGSPVLISARLLARPLAHALAEQRAQDGYSPAGLPPVLAPRLSEALPSITVSTLGRSYQDVIGNLVVSGRWLPTSLVAARLAESRKPLADLATTIARVMRSSGRVAIGSDAPAVAYGKGFYDELVLLAEQKIPTDQILRWATAGGAIALGLSLDLGTIEPGRLADLVIVDGNPLAAIGDLRRIVAVVKGGVWFDVAAFGSMD
jgi:cytosine/adenosine deaminase-related metal-dependent hydrolase